MVADYHILSFYYIPIIVLKSKYFKGIGNTGILHDTCGNLNLYCVPRTLPAYIVQFTHTCNLFLRQAWLLWTKLTDTHGAAKLERWKRWYESSGLDVRPSDIIPKTGIHIAVSSLVSRGLDQRQPFIGCNLQDFCVSQRHSSCRCAYLPSQID